MKTATIVLPTYNEAGNIKEVIQEIFKQQEKLSNWLINILVVDDNSLDQTAFIVKKLQRQNKNIHLITGKKEGLGKAYTRGFSYAITNLKADIVFEMDADLSHPPSLIPKMLARIDKGADFVIGARYIKGGAIPKDWGIHRKIFSGFGNIIVQLGFMNFKINDWTSGFRAIKAKTIKNILPEINKYSGYVFQIALLDKAIKMNAKIEQVPLKFKERKKGVSKINFIDFILNIFSYIIGNSAFVKYLIVGFSGFFIDFLMAFLLITYINVSKPLANTVSAELAIINNFFLNNFWAFKHKQIKGNTQVYIKKFILFNLVSSGALLIQGVGMFVALSIFGDTSFSIRNISLPSWIVYKVFLIAFLVIPYSYIMYNKVVWKK
jgi:dolichol-phosphate mannosyltransferase